MVHQSTFPFFDFSDATENFAQGSSEERGAVFTRAEVVGFILDLVGYTADKPLHRFRILEPSFGDGDFLLPVIERLLKSYKACSPSSSHALEDLSESITAVELNEESVRNTRNKVQEMLLSYGLSVHDTGLIVDSWIVKGDFLLVDLPHTFTHVVGNPPYVRQELIPDTLLNEYRARYHTIYDRADLYIPFIERCLIALAAGGTLGFICSDRWMKNRYGGPLRAMVSKQYHLVYYIDMVDTPAFHSDVIAYPAITIIRREKPGPTRIARRPQIAAKALEDLSHAMSSEAVPDGKEIIEVSRVATGRDPWVLHSFDQLEVVRRLEAEFPLLEETGCRVGIGVATGADRVFIGPYGALDVEESRKLPLVRTKDIDSGTVQWRGYGLINPFNDDGSLVDLNDFPKLAGYFEKHADIIRKRHCAKDKSRGWYRTIDRIYPSLTREHKLLIPDIKGEANIVYEDGHFYPHHNLYYITSGEWDLKALQAVLRSGIAKLFVSIYSVQMRGGYLRFQAQYLRRIRLPQWKDVPSEIKATLATFSDEEDKSGLDEVVALLYGLSKIECQAIGAGKNGDCGQS